MSNGEDAAEILEMLGDGGAELLTSGRFKQIDKSVEDFLKAEQNRNTGRKTETDVSWIPCSCKLKIQICKHSQVSQGAEIWISYSHRPCI